MEYLNNNCSSSGFDLIGLSSSLAIFISKNANVDDISLLGAFFSTLGDNLSLIAAYKSACESKNHSET